MNRAELLQAITIHFNKEELKSLCFELNIDYENLAANTKEGIARELVLQSEKTGQFSDLIALCRARRPNFFRPDDGYTGAPPESPLDVPNPLRQAQSPSRVGQPGRGKFRLVLVIGIAILLALGIAFYGNVLVPDETPAPIIQPRGAAAPATSPLTSCPETIVWGKVSRCEITTRGSINSHTFEVTQDEYVYLSITNETRNGLFSPRVIVSDPVKNPIFQNFDSSGTATTIHAPNSGIYTIQVQDSDQADTGKYALYLQRLRNPLAAQSIGVGEQINSSFTEAYQQDAYTFEATASEQVAIEVSEIPLTGPIGLRVTIYNQNGDKEFEGINHSGLNILFNPSNSGTYIMFVSNPEIEGEIGEYFVFRK